MKPSWDKLKRDKALKQMGVKFVEVEDTEIDNIRDSDPKFFKKITANGSIVFPLITKIVNGRAKKYKGERSFDSMKQDLVEELHSSKKT
jgi:hypothetical protein